MKCFVLLILLFLQVRASSQILDTGEVQVTNRQFKKIMKNNINLLWYTIQNKVQITKYPNFSLLYDTLYSYEDSLTFMHCEIYATKAKNRRKGDYIIITNCAEIFDSFEYYNPSGILLIKGRFQCSDDKNGLWKYYYKSGKLKMEGTYKRDKRIGKWKYYDKTGKLKREQDY